MLLCGGKPLGSIGGSNLRLTLVKKYQRSNVDFIPDIVREIKVGFARYYNRRHNRRGYIWGDRFKSVIVDKGETLVNCLAYIDLNPLRAGLV